MPRSFSVPADFKPETLKAFTELGRRYPGARVRCVYGNLTKGEAVSASGRPAALLPEADLEKLTAYVKRCGEAGISFHYTLNPTHLGNREFTPEGAAAIKGLLRSIHEAGVRSIVVALPSLIELIRSTGLEFEITASVLCGVDTVNRAREVRRLGADAFVADESIVRDFALLERLAKAFPGRMELIVNPYCHKECVYRTAHYNQVSELDRTPAAAAEYFHNRCLARLSEHPANGLKRMWIRPEDLESYTRVGIDRFKIQGRHLLAVDVGSRTRRGDLVRTAESYMRGSHDGDLNDLIYLFNPVLRHLRVPLENSKLDGFLRPFARGERSCGRDCAACGYCDGFAKRVVDHGELCRVREAARELFNEADPFKKMIWEGADPPEGFPL